MESDRVLLKASDLLDRMMAGDVAKFVKRAVATMALAAVTFGLGGCQSVTGSTSVSQIRFIDASIEAGGIDVYMSNAAVAYNLGFGTITSYIRAKAESLGMTAKVGVAERAERLVSILVATGFNGLFGLPILTEVTLWALTLASGITVVQRIAVVRKQALTN